MSYDYDSNFEMELIEEVIADSSDSINDFKLNDTSTLNSETRENEIPAIEPNLNDSCKACSQISTFPPIFILNLDRAKERWRNTVNVFKEAGFNETELNRLSAVDGRKLSEKDLAANSTLLARYFQPRGVIGCYLSHRSFWQMVVDRNYSSAIVVEDDIRLVAGFRDRLVQAMQDLCQETVCPGREGPVDVALLGALGQVHPEGQDTPGAKFFAYYMGGGRPFKKISDSIFQPARPAGTHGYLVTREGALKLLALCPKAVFHIDLDAWRHRSLKIVMFHPALVYQTFDSTSLTDVSQSNLASASPPPSASSAGGGVGRGGLLSRKKVRLLAGGSTLGTSDDAKENSSSGAILDLQISATNAITRRLPWLFLADPYTQQPISHVLDEPLLQLGPGGPVLTVGRNVKILSAMVFMSSYFAICGQRFLSKLFFGGAVGLLVSVRSLIWLLMNWK